MKKIRICFFDAKDYDINSFNNALLDPEGPYNIRVVWHGFLRVTNQVKKVLRDVTHNAVDKKYTTLVCFQPALPDDVNRL